MKVYTNLIKAVHTWNSFFAQCLLKYFFSGNVVISTEKLCKKQKHCFNYERTLALNSVGCRIVEWLYRKVHIFWEGHIILRNLHLTFDWHNITSESQKNLTKRSSVLLLCLVRFSTTQTLKRNIKIFLKMTINENKNASSERTWPNHVQLRKKPTLHV